VLEDGLDATEVAMRQGDCRQRVHAVLRRYRESGMAADRLLPATGAVCAPTSQVWVARKAPALAVA
jgi:hypothetical protein